MIPNPIVECDSAIQTWSCVLSQGARDGGEGYSEQVAVTTHHYDQIDTDRDMTEANVKLLFQYVPKVLHQ